MAILNFEDLPSNTEVTTQYGDRGVLFPNSAFLNADPAARSGTRVLRAGDPGDEFHTGPFVIQFTSAQVRVRLFAGGNFEPANGVLRAFNSAGAIVAQDGPKPVTPNQFTTPFEVRAANPAIVRVELEMGVTVFEAIDDLEFEGEAPPPPPLEPPIVRITFPGDATELDSSDIRVQGTVTGEGLFGKVTLQMQFGLPPGSTAPGLSTTVPLIGAGTVRSFVQVVGITLAPHTLTVEAENIGGLKGSHTVRFTNLPEAIRARHAAEGGTATLGELQYGSIEGECKLAVYERGAIAAAGPTTFVVRGAIFDKWFALEDPFGIPGRLGCPTSEARDAPGGATAQDFERGRIYAGLPTGAHYVPDVFVQAIEQLGGEAATGVPLADPSDSIGVMQTWLFQQFTRLDNPQLLPSTLEIRGTPPTLWVERQGGDLSFFEGIPLAPRLPTIWQEFTCDSNLGPCNIILPTSPTSDPRLENAGDHFCNGKAWEDVLEDLVVVGAAPGWVAIRGDHVLTPILGIVTKSRKAEWDHPQVHEHHAGPPKFASDWNVFVRPFHPFRDLFADNLEKGTVELEFEAYFANAFRTAFDLPFIGDLLFASGRWIIDCQHRPFDSEIHPPAVMVHMRTVTFNGRPATEANIWVNGFYTGAPVEFEIFPPPRPSPDALLLVSKPKDSEAATDVNVEFSFRPAVWSNHVRVRFTASSRRNKVTKLGEMKWEFGRAYYGRWHVSWEAI
jgi:hypothetical protein